VFEALKSFMSYRGTNAVQPGTPIGGARRGECRARELFGVQPERTALRRIAPSRQCTCQCLGGKFIAEAAHIPIGIRSDCAHGTILCHGELKFQPKARDKGISGRRQANWAGEVPTRG
jgi:hypothetical protein